MRRRLLNHLTLLSLLLCVAVVVLFVVGVVHPFAHTFTRNRPLFGEVPVGRTRYELQFEPYGASFQAVPDIETRGFSMLQGQGPMVKPREFRPDTASTFPYVVFAATRGTGTLLYGIDVTGPLGKSGVPYYKVEVSYLFLAILSLALPGARLMAHELRLVREAERRVAGLCPKCGYDLRATQGRCPECGEGVAGQAATTSCRWGQVRQASPSGEDNAMLWPPNIPEYAAEAQAKLSAWDGCVWRPEAYGMSHASFLPTSHRAAGSTG